MKKGQMLVITLLVLAIIGIAIIGIVNIVSRDTNQVVVNRQFEETYTVSENVLREMMDLFGKKSRNLLNIDSDSKYGEKCEQKESTETLSGIAKKYLICRLDSDFVSEQVNIPINADVTIRERKEISGLQVYKDKPVDINIENYKEAVEISWNSSTSLAFDIVFIYSDSTKKYNAKQDLANKSGVIDSGGTDANGPLRLDQSINSKIKLNIANFCDSSCTPILLSITPRANSNPTDIKFSLVPSNIETFPAQARIFTINSDIETEDDSATSNLTTEVSLVSQPDPIWGYSLFTDELILP